MRSRPSSCFLYLGLTSFQNLTSWPFQSVTTDWLRLEPVGICSHLSEGGTQPRVPEPTGGHSKFKT